MAIKITWSITGLKAYPSVENRNNVVFSADWKCSGKNDDGVEASTSGSHLIDFVNSPDFKPIDELKEADVIRWVHNAMTTPLVESIENQVCLLVGEAALPAVITPELPWLKAFEEVPQ